MHPATTGQTDTPAYCWIIDIDHDPDTAQPEGTNLNAKGVMGGANADVTLLDGETERFRLLDDDGNVYYEGRIAGDYEGFEPLYDFGMPNAGAVSIQYFKGTTTEVVTKEIWEEL